MHDEPTFGEEKHVVSFSKTIERGGGGITTSVTRQAIFEEKEK